MDTEEWDDLIETHAWYNGAGANNPSEKSEGKKSAREFIDATADK